MGTLTNDRLGRTDENGQKRFRTENRAGMHGEWLSVAFRFPPFVSVRFRSAPAETIHIIHAMLCRHGLSLIPCNKIKNHSHKQNEVRNISDADS